MEERFRPINGFDNYMVSDQGRVMNKKTQRILKTTRDDMGKHKVMLYANKTPRTIYIHRLVAQAFYPMTYSDGFAVAHISKDFDDNSVGNLEVTRRRSRMPDVWL